GNDADGPLVLVRVVAGDAPRAAQGIARADALVVGNEQRVVHRIEHHRARRIADRDQAQDGVPHALTQVNYGDCVGIVERNVGNVVLFIDGDRVWPGTVGGFAVARHTDRKPKVYLTNRFVGGRVDDREGVAIGIGDQQAIAPEGHTRWVETGFDAVGDLEGTQVNHGNRAGGRRASRIGGNDRNSVRVLLEVILVRNAAGLVRDVSGLAIRRNHNAVRHVANANLLTLYRRLCGQVNLGQRVVRVQHDISSLVIRRDRNPGGVRGALRNGNAAGNG